MTKEELIALTEGLPLSEDTVEKMQQKLQESIGDAVSKARVETASEIQSLKEEIELLEHENEDLIEKAEEYAELLKTELQEQHETELTDQRENLIEKAEEYAGTIAEEYANKLESYAQYVVENFVQENKESLIESRKYEKMCEVVEGIKNSLQESLNLVVEPSDETAELNGKLEESKNEYNKLAEAYANLRKEVADLEKKNIFESETKNLADTQKEKVQRLMEGTEVSSDEYRRRLKLVVEEVSTEKMITETVEKPQMVSNPGFKYDGSVEFPTKMDVDFDERMQRYLKSLA